MFRTLGSVALHITQRGNRFAVKTFLNAIKFGHFSLDHGPSLSGPNWTSSDDV